MPEILRLTPSQRSRCNRLIKRLCANYDDGNCLLLDDGEPCVCPQTISYSLLCRYFRNAVLPAEKELYADIFKQRTYHCAECGAAFVPNSNRETHRQTMRFFPSLAQVTRLYGEPHSPQTSSSVRAYLPEYFPSSVLPLFCSTFRLLERRVISFRTRSNVSLEMMAGWLFST